MGNAGFLAAEAPPTLDRVLARIDEISTLPQVALNVMEVANDPRSGAADLKEVMETDAALSARVLRCVNSSAYGARERITNLQQAIAYLGLKQIRNLAITASVSELFRGADAIGNYSRKGLWRHCVAVGLCARLLAMRRRIDQFEDVFLAGLLHDIGIILEDQHVHGHFRRVLAAMESGGTFPENERQILGFDHTILGGRIAEKWRFPESVRTAIRYHHNPSGYKGQDLTTLHCVQAANAICTLKGYTAVGVKLADSFQEAILALALTREDILVLAEDLDQALAEHALLFQI